MRLFERALSRAQLPVKFSEGFNPRPQLSLPVPRAVGITGEAEVLLVGFSAPIDPEDVLFRLGEQMPAGIELLSARSLEGKSNLRIDCVYYAVEIPEEQSAAVSQVLCGLLESETWFVERTVQEGEPGKRIDLRSFLVEACMEAGELRWAVMITDKGTVRPVEFLSAVGLDTQLFQHSVRRTAVHIFGDDRVG
jgi:radical SAM-linked protein